MDQYQFNPWVITSGSSYDGNLSARSGAISHNGSTSLAIRTVYAKDDSVRFFYRVSSSQTMISLHLNLMMLKYSKNPEKFRGQKPQLQFSAGLNKMEWIYRKDISVSDGSDCA